MKIQCSCGAKYVIDVAPGMENVTFVCRQCGQDYSAVVNELIRKELGQQPAPSQAQQAPVPAPPDAPPSAPSAASPAAPEAPRLRISRPHAPEAPAPQPEQIPVSKYCPRHRTEVATDHCQVCKKPICPKCMENFGPFCSPFCRSKVEGPSMNAPVHVGNRVLAERRFWRKTGRISAVAGAIVFLALGFWIWYAWIGSMPRVYFSIGYDDISHSGGSWIVQPDQIVFLHGGTLARYDLKTKQKVWSLDLITSDQVTDVLNQQDEESQRRQPQQIREKYARIGLEQELSLRGEGKNIWVADGNVLTQFDWETGNVLQQITLTNQLSPLSQEGDDLLAVNRPENGVEAITRVNIGSGQMSAQAFSGASAGVIAQNAPPPRQQAGGGLPLSPYSRDRGLNSQRVAQQAQNMSFPARLALPALLASSEHNQQIEDEIRSEDASENSPQYQAARIQAAQKVADMRNASFIPDGDTFIAFDAQLLKQNLVQREAMKAPSGNSALNNANLSAANESDAVNEQLNDMQRMRDQDTVTEDESSYRVSIRRLDSPQPDWTGEVIGPPQFYPLQTVNVLCANNTLIVFDKTNKKLWQSELTYNVPAPADGQSEYGEGPCVETNGVLYVFDQAVLTAFDPSTGNARWRIPSVGIVGLFFDGQGMVYVNTTSGNPDDIKYSRQIDVTKQTEAVVLKVDPASGKILWSARPGGFVSYLSGDFMYATQSFDPGDEDEQQSDALAGLENPAYLRLIRMNPDNGHVLWQHDEGYAPVNIHFDHNFISIISKKGVEVLHFFSL